MILPDVNLLIYLRQHGSPTPISRHWRSSIRPNFTATTPTFRGFLGSAGATRCD